MTERRKIARQGFAVLALALLAAPVAAAEKGEIHIGLNNWPENIAVSNMWKILLEERGYDVELTNADKSVIYSGIATDSLDIGLEVWMPTTDRQFYERYEDDITLHEPWYRGTGLGLVVPTYVEIDSVEELRENQEQFVYDGRPAIVGIDPGSALMGLTEQLIEDYDLDMQLISSSDPAMMAALSRFYRNEEPIVVTLWSPHWAFAEYDLKYLDEPQGVYGQGEDILWMSRPELEEEHPEVVKWMNAWEMNDQQIGELMAMLRDADDPAAGANQWIEENGELVESWFED